MKSLLTPEDVAELLGISVHTIYAKTSRKNQTVKLDLPPWIKIGKLVRFPSEDFQEWLSGKERLCG